jgi:hypothetical protein
MSKDDNRADEIDWSLTTWEGARREQARRWARMPLAELILALEEMQVLAEQLSQPSAAGTSTFSADLTFPGISKTAIHQSTLYNTMCGVYGSRHSGVAA